MAQEGYVWITKDYAARVKHRDTIRQSRISVVWVRGAEPMTGNNISIEQLRRMLTVKLDDISIAVSNSQGPGYFLLYMRGNTPMLLIYSTPE